MDSLKQKLNPSRFPGMSPFMAANDHATIALESDDRNRWFDDLNRRSAMAAKSTSMSVEEQQLRREMTGLHISRSHTLNSPYLDEQRRVGAKVRAKLARLTKEASLIGQQIDRLQKRRMEADNPLRPTLSVLKHHLAAFDGGDMDAILSDYAKDAVLMTPEGSFRGHSQIKPVFRRLLDDVFSTCSKFTMIRQMVRGNLAYIVWSAESKKVKVTLGTDTYVIQFGKIVAQTFAAEIKVLPG